MSSEERVKAEPCAGTFDGCLVEGDPERSARERKIKRRAIAISIALQTAGLAVLVIAPLLAKPAELTERIAVPIPPYRNSPPHPTESSRLPNTTIRNRFCTTCPINVSPRVPSPAPGDSQINNERPEDGVYIDREGPHGSGPNIFDSRKQPKPPEDQTPEKKRIVIGHIVPALLTHKVEPVFPVLPHQLHRSGKVELHAVIAVDGTIQSLQAVSGDPLFISSALEAVRQWRYQPTYLNGQPVEVDTYITVIYTLQ